MHHSTKRRVVLGMTTGGLLIGGLGMGVAQADTTANGGSAGSPGVLSGNLIQIPVSIPINVCGNSVSVVGILDSASGNSCTNAGSTGSTANGGASNSPGVGSGNLIQIPVSIPVNVCGNSVSGVGVGDSASGNKCSNGSGSGSNGGPANGGSSHSPGVGSGNTVQVPVTALVNACGNDVSVVGILDSATGNNCGNGSSTPTTPGHPCGCHPATPPSTPTPPATPPKHHPHHHVSPTSTHKPKFKASGTLAETGSGASKVVAPLGASVLGGSGLVLRKRVSTLRHSAHRH
jgi:hypothetical protein